MGGSKGNVFLVFEHAVTEFRPRPLLVLSFLLSPQVIICGFTLMFLNKETLDCLTIGATNCLFGLDIFLFIEFCHCSSIWFTYQILTRTYFSQGMQTKSF